MKELPSSDKILIRSAQITLSPPKKYTIHLGTGTDVAMESADITLISGDLRGV